jgi:hypothetical protein
MNNNEQDENIYQGDEDQQYYPTDKEVYYGCRLAGLDPHNDEHKHLVMRTISRTAELANDKFHDKREDQLSMADKDPDDNGRYVHGKVSGLLSDENSFKSACRDMCNVMQIEEAESEKRVEQPADTLVATTSAEVTNSAMPDALSNTCDELNLDFEKLERPKIGLNKKKNDKEQKSEGLAD